MEPSIDPLPSPGLDRRSIFALFLAVLAGGGVGGVAGAFAPLRDPSADDPVAALYRYAEAAGGMVEWNEDGPLTRSLQLDQGGIVFGHTTDGRILLSLIGVDQRADPAIAALFDTLADLAASNP